jgi:hypothetical protein
MWTDERRRTTGSPAGTAGGGGAVDEFDVLVVEGDHALGVDLAERDLEPRAVPARLVEGQVADTRGLLGGLVLSLGVAAASLPLLGPTTAPSAVRFE